MSEPVDVKKVVDISPATLVKTSSSTAKGLMVILGVAAILFCVYFTVSRLFKKPVPTQPITVQPGGKVDIHNEAPRKSFIVFVEPWFGTSTQNKWDAGIRAGVRYEF